MIMMFKQQRRNDASTQLKKGYEQEICLPEKLTFRVKFKIFCVACGG
jgi:hypothetical protein